MIRAFKCRANHVRTTSGSKRIQINITSEKNEILIKRGQPLALVIPYKKEDLEIEYKLLEEEKHYQKLIAKDKFSLINVFTNRYHKSKL